MARGFWTDTRIAQLKRLWRTGRTAAAIGRELGGISRAAVLGKFADLTSITVVYQVCAFLPLLGLLAAFLPSVSHEEPPVPQPAR